MSAFTFTQKEKEELEKVGELFRNTIYDKELRLLPDIVTKFGIELKKLDGDMYTSIVPAVFRFSKLICSNYISHLLKLIDNLRKNLTRELPKDILLRILCRQKSWESYVRKIISNYFEGTSTNLFDIVALRIIIDSDRSDKEMESICQKITSICINFFEQNMCTIMPPAKKVGTNMLFKDYISFPKPNGYKSIHLAFMDSHNYIFELQIRTQKMDANAEFGLITTSAANNKKENSKKLKHSDYKIEEYSAFISYISFDPLKVDKPFFRCYPNPNTDSEEKYIIVDNIGLMKAKPIDERSKTFY